MTFGVFGTSLISAKQLMQDNETMAMYRLAAQQGNVEAELKLGDYHYYGLGTPVDLEASVTHYRAAAESRNAQAMFNLAHMYAHGLGLTGTQMVPRSRRTC